MTKKTSIEIKYKQPKVFLLQHTGIGTSEFAARTAYDSFNQATDNSIKFLASNADILEPDSNEFFDIANDINDLDKSELLNTLAWTYFHHSVLEHAVLTFYIKDIGRGVLQELVRHRIASYTVKSTRYTMSSVLNAYVASSMNWKDVSIETAKGVFNNILKSLNMFIYDNDRMLKIETDSIYDKLSAQVSDYSDLLSKEGIDVLSRWRDLDNNLFDELQKTKKKRNIGDNYKHIVTDNWKTELVMTINLRSLKNFLELRDSGSAWFQMQTLAKEIKNQTPTKYLKLIDKNFKDK